jgi:hypothetical protein
MMKESGHSYMNRNIIRLPEIENNAASAAADNEVFQTHP